MNVGASSRGRGCAGGSIVLARIGAAVIEFSYGSLATNPHRVGKPLRFELEGLHSARRGDFRITYRISDVATVIAIEHRADVYRPR